MSSFVYVCDRGGAKIRFRKDGGVLYPPSFPEDIVSQLAGLQLRDDDVLIAAWMRSGTHWAWELIRMILNGKAEYDQEAKLRTMLEFEPVTSLNEMPSPRILNTHLHFRYLPEDRKRKSIKAPLTEARKICKFLSSDIEEETMNEIVEKCRFNRMKEDKEPLEPLQGLHFKKGKAGTWKSVFTVEQYEMFEKMYREKMAGSKFEQLYKGPVDVL